MRSLKNWKIRSGDRICNGNVRAGYDTGADFRGNLRDFGLEISDKIPAAFECDCSKERVSRAISTLSKKDLDSIINDGEAIEVKCQFCNKAYHFDVDELKEMRSAK